jgi:hypothetical protein
VRLSGAAFSEGCARIRVPARLRRCDF